MRYLLLAAVLLVGCSSSREHSEPDVSVQVIGSTQTKVFLHVVGEPWKVRIFDAPRLVPEGVAVLRHQVGRTYRLTYQWQSVLITERLTF